MSQEPAPPPDVEWVKVSGPDALAPLDRHWIRLLRVALLAAAVLIAWRILAWQEDSYQLAAAGAPAAQTNAGSMVTAPPIPETPVPTAVPVVVISPTPTPHGCAHAHANRAAHADAQDTQRCGRATPCR